MGEETLTTPAVSAVVGIRPIMLQPKIQPPGNVVHCMALSKRISGANPVATKNDASTLYDVDDAFASLWEDKYAQQKNSQEYNWVNCNFLKSVTDQRCFGVR